MRIVNHFVKAGASDQHYWQVGGQGKTSEEKVPRFLCSGKHHLGFPGQPVGGLTSVFSFVTITLDGRWGCELQLGLDCGLQLGLDCELELGLVCDCLLYTSPSPRDLSTSRMPSSA